MTRYVLHAQLAVPTEHEMTKWGLTPAWKVEHIATGEDGRPASAAVKIGQRTWTFARAGDVATMSTEDDVPLPLSMPTSPELDVACMEAFAAHGALASGKAPRKGTYRANALPSADVLAKMGVVMPMPPVPPPNRVSPLPSPMTMSASRDAVSRKIKLLMDEGKPQDQAVAIALDMARRGELGKAVEESCAKGEMDQYAYEGC